MAWAPLIGTMDTPSASRSRPDRRADSVKASSSVTPSTKTIVRTAKSWPGRPGGRTSRMDVMEAMTLNNGVEMPALGLGVFQTPPEETRDAVTAAIDSGYRLIDTAAGYGNERQVGDAVRSSGVHWSDVFLETKIWISDYGYDEALHGFDKSAGK